VNIRSILSGFARLRPTLLAVSVLAVAAAAFSAPAAPPRAPAANPPAKPTPDVIGVVDGVPIMQSEWDRLAAPYFQEVEAKAGRKLSDDEKRLLRKNLLDELIRERLWLADAHRRGMRVNEDVVDARMKENAFFKVKGKVDESKFLAFKRSPTSNYALLRDQVAMGILLEDYARWMERRFGPREPEVRKAYQDLASQASVRYFVLGPEAVSLEPEAEARQIRAYYEAHQQEFQSPDSAWIQYVRVPIEAASGDSAKDAAVAGAQKAATDLVGAMQSGAPVETAAKVYGGLHDTGWFRLSDPIRGLGRSEAIQDAIRGAAPGTWVKTPIRAGAHYVVIRLVDRRAARIQSFREVAGQAKRRADAQIREGLADSLGREELRLHPQTYAVPRLAATVIARSSAEIDTGAAPSSKEIQKLLEKRRKEAKIKKSNRAWLDSLAAALPAEVRKQRRDEAIQRAFRETVARLRSGAPGARVANETGGVAQAVDLYRGQPIEEPILLEGSFLDSLYTMRPGVVVGPRAAHDSLFVVRVDRIDPGFVPPYEAVRQAASSNAQMVKRWALEKDAETYYEAHKEDFKTKPEWIFDYVYFKRAHPDSVPVPDSAIAAYYNEHPLEFTTPATAKPRIILFQYRPADGPEARDKALQRANAAHDRIAKGEDFAAVAKEVSDDRESGEQGGLIGDVTKSRLMKELADVIFTIPVGQVSDVVEARSSFHLIKVDERTGDTLRPLSEARSEIQTVLGQPVADSLAFLAAKQFIDSLQAGTSFDSLAAAHGGALRSGPTQAGEALPGIGPFETVATAIGDIADGATTPEPVQVGEGYLVARRVREVEPAPAPFAEIKERVIGEYQMAQRRALADSVDQKLREAVAHGENVEALFDGLGGMRMSRPFARSGPIPDFKDRDPRVASDSVLLERIFTSRPGKVLPPVKSSMGTIYMIVESVTVPPAVDFARHRDEVWRDIVDRRIEAWTARLRSRAQVVVYRKDLKSLLAAG